MGCMCFKYLFIVYSLSLFFFLCFGWTEVFHFNIVKLVICGFCFSSCHMLLEKCFKLQRKAISLPVCRKQLKMLKKCSITSLGWHPFTVVSTTSPVNTIKQSETMHPTTKMRCGFWAVLTSRICQVTWPESPCHTRNSLTRHSSCDMPEAANLRNYSDVFIPFRRKSMWWEELFKLRFCIVFVFSV